jgi:hypothetical protein
MAIWKEDILFETPCKLENDLVKQLGIPYKLCEQKFKHSRVPTGVIMSEFRSNNYEITTVGLRYDHYWPLLPLFTLMYYHFYHHLSCHYLQAFTTITTIYICHFYHNWQLLSLLPLFTTIFHTTCTIHQYLPLLPLFVFTKISTTTHNITSNCRHSCSELVGSPIHRISFLSLLIMFIAHKTFSASYTRLLMFLTSNDWE